MAKPSFCSLPAIREIETWVRQTFGRIEEPPSRSPLRVKEAWRRIDKLPSDAPYQPGASLSQAMVRIQHRVLKDLSPLERQLKKDAAKIEERVWRKHKRPKPPPSGNYNPSREWLAFSEELKQELAPIRARRKWLDEQKARQEAQRAAWAQIAQRVEKVASDLIPAEKLWGDPATRAVVTRAAQAETPAQAREILANWLQDEAPQEFYRAELIRNPRLPAFLTLIGPRPQKLNAPTLLFNPVGTQAPLTRRQAELLREAIDNPEQWPQLSQLLVNLTGYHIEVVDQIYDDLWGAVTPIVAKYAPHAVDDRGRIKGFGIIDIYTWLWPKLDEGEQKIIAEALVKAGFPQSDDTLAEVNRKLIMAVEADLRHQLDQLPNWFRDRWPNAYQAIMSTRITQRSLGLVRPAFLAENEVDLIAKTALAGRLFGGVMTAVYEQLAYLNGYMQAMHLPLSVEETRELVIPTTGLDAWLAKRGISLPQAVSANFERLFSAPEFGIFSPRNAAIWDIPWVQRIAGPRPPETGPRAALREAAGIQDAQEGPQLWQLPARAVVSTAAWLSAWVRVLATSQESAFRKQACQFTAGSAPVLFGQGAPGLYRQAAPQRDGSRRLPCLLTASWSGLPPFDSGDSWRP